MKEIYESDRLIFNQYMWDVYVYKSLCVCKYICGTTAWKYICGTTMSNTHIIDISFLNTVRLRIV